MKVQDLLCVPDKRLPKDTVYVYGGDPEDLYEEMLRVLCGGEVDEEFLKKFAAIKNIATEERG